MAGGVFTGLFLAALLMATACGPYVEEDADRATRTAGAGESVIAGTPDSTATAPMRTETPCSSCTVPPGSTSTAQSAWTPAAEPTLTPNLASTPEPTFPPHEARTPPLPPPFPLTTGRMAIPALGIDAPVERRSNGELRLESPTAAGVVAWYEFTWAPGDGGNAVFSGHVAHEGAAGVFAELHLLAVGDIVVLTMIDGRELQYAVTETRTMMPPEGIDLPYIFDPTPQDSITLITALPYDALGRTDRPHVIVRAVLRSE